MQSTSGNYRDERPSEPLSAAWHDSVPQHVRRETDVRTLRTEGALQYLFLIPILSITLA